MKDSNDRLLRNQSDDVEFKSSETSVWSEKGKKHPGKRRVLHVSFKEQEYFTENLALLLKSAVPIGDILQSLMASSRSKQYRTALTMMQEDIDGGSNLSTALANSGIVNSQTLALVRVGESSGNLVDSLQLAAQQEEKRHTFHAKLRSAALYPVIVVGLTLIVGIAIAWFLLPKLSVTFSQLNVTLPAISRFMLGGGTWLKDHGIIAVPSFIIFLIIAGYILFAAPKTKIVGQMLILKIPGLSRLVREIETAQFGYLFSALLDAGLSITDALRLLADASTSYPYHKMYLHLADALGEGYSLKDALSTYPASQRLLTPSVQQMLFAGEKSGALPDVLKTIGRTYEQKSEVTTSNLEAIIEPALLVVVAIGVLLVAVGVILPIYSLVGGLNQ